MLHYITNMWLKFVVLNYHLCKRMKCRRYFLQYQGLTCCDLVKVGSFILKSGYRQLASVFQTLDQQFYQNLVDYIYVLILIHQLVFLDLGSNKMNNCVGFSPQSVNKLTSSPGILHRGATTVWSSKVGLKNHIIGCIDLWESIFFSFSY